MKYQILKPLSIGGGKLLPRGAVVDASGWPVQNVNALVKQRYMQEAIELAADAPEQPQRGRKGAQS